MAGPIKDVAIVQQTVQVAVLGRQLARIGKKVVVAVGRAVRHVAIVRNAVPITVASAHNRLQDPVPWRQACIFDQLEFNRVCNQIRGVNGGRGTNHPAHKRDWGLVVKVVAGREVASGHFEVQDDANEERCSRRSDVGVGNVEQRVLVEVDDSVSQSHRVDDQRLGVKRNAVAIGIGPHAEACGSSRKSIEQGEIDSGHGFESGLDRK